MLHNLKLIKKSAIVLISILFLFLLNNCLLTVQAEEMDEQIKLAGQLIEIAREEDRWLLPIDFFEQKELSERQFPTLDEIDSLAYIVTDLDTDEILLEKGADEIAYPASMTKILTAITVLESSDFAPEKPVTFSEYALDLPSPESVRSGYGLGTTITTDEALHLLMVASANDCARALAETYGGTEENFVDMMNDKATEIGATSTHMVDAAGFGLEDHFFTPRDLAKIIQYSMKNDTFRELVNTKKYITSYHLPGTNNGVFANSNKLLLQGDQELASPYLHTYDGVKTGTTDLAGYCLSATVHTYDGRHLCGIIFNGRLSTSDTAPNIAVLLRTILEEAARQASCPQKADAVHFLAEHPDLLSQMREKIFEQTLNTFVQQDYLTAEEKDNLLHNVQQTSSGASEEKEDGGLFGNLLGKGKNKSESDTVQPENDSDLQGSEQSEENQQNDNTQSFNFLKNPQKLAIMAAIIVLAAALIYLVYKIFSNHQKENK